MPRTKKKKRMPRILVTIFKVLAAGVGFTLAWTGWTGPELLENIASADALGFVSSDVFRTVLVIVGLSVLLFTAVKPLRFWERKKRLSTPEPEPDGQPRRPSTKAGLRGWSAWAEPSAEGIDLTLIGKAEIYGFRCEVTIPGIKQPFVKDDATIERGLGLLGPRDLPGPSRHGSFTFPFAGAPSFNDLPYGPYFVEWWGWDVNDDDDSDPLGLNPPPLLVQQYAFELGPGGAVTPIDASRAEIYEGLTQGMMKAEQMDTTMRIACQQQLEASSDEERKSIQQKAWEEQSAWYNDLVWFIKQFVPSEVARFVQDYELKQEPMLRCTPGSIIPYWYMQQRNRMQRLEELIGRYAPR